jgi:hypothetical protein
MLAVMAPPAFTHPLREVVTEITNVQFFLSYLSATSIRITEIEDKMKRLRQIIFPCFYMFICFSLSATFLWITGIEDKKKRLRQNIFPYFYVFKFKMFSGFF